MRLFLHDSDLALSARTIAQMKKEMAFHPVTFEENVATLPPQHVIVFRRS